MTLTPGQRIDLIKATAGALEKHTYTDVDLILGQHKLNLFDGLGYDDDFLTRIIYSVRVATDEQLQQLYAYVLGDQTTMESDIPWSSTGARLFISHLAKHHVLMGGIAEHMSGYGVECLVAHRDIAPSKEWQDQIEAGLRTAHACAAMLHPGFHESSWCDQEIGYVLSRRMPFLPMSFEGQLPYGFMGKFQAQKIRPAATSLDVAALLMNWLIAVPTLQPMLTASLVQALQDSRAWDHTRKLMVYIDQVASFTSEQAAAVRTAIEINRQVGEGNYKPAGSQAFMPVPERLEQVLNARTVQ